MIEEAARNVAAAEHELDLFVTGRPPLQTPLYAYMRACA